MKRMNCDGICHACAAFASVQQMEKYAGVQRKFDFNLSRELAVSVLFWAVVASIALFLRFII